MWDTLDNLWLAGADSSAATADVRGLDVLTSPSILLFSHAGSLRVVSVFFTRRVRSTTLGGAQFVALRTILLSLRLYIFCCSLEYKSCILVSKVPQSYNRPDLLPFS